MTHQIISIDEYLHETSEIAKRNKLRRFVLTCTLFLASLSLGFGIYSSSEVIQYTDNQETTTIISVSDDDTPRFGKVFLAFDPDELNGIEDLDAFLNEDEKMSSHTDQTAYDFHRASLTEEEVRNQIVITGNYYAGN